MKVKLVNLVSVKSGYTFRSGLKGTNSGEFKVIQMKDLSSNGIVDCSDLSKVEECKFGDGSIIKRNDLVFRSRGVSMSSAILLENLNKCVVAAPLYRIRVNNEGELLPEYLNWYLSQRRAQNFFERYATGSGSQMVSMSDLEQLEIVVPLLDKQKLIVEIANLSQRQSDIVSKIELLRLKNVKSILSNCIKRG